MEKNPDLTLNNYPKKDFLFLSNDDSKEINKKFKEIQKMGFQIIKSSCDYIYILLTEAEEREKEKQKEREQQQKIEKEKEREENMKKAIGEYSNKDRKIFEENIMSCHR